MSNSVNKNTVFNAIKTIFGIIYPLITFPYISRVLMADNVGKINFSSSIVSYFSLIASLGVTTYAIRECSRVRENKEELDNTASQILSINIISTLVAYIALFIILIVARPLDNYRELICIQSATILFKTLGADWINSAMEDFKYIAIRTVGMQVFSLVLMFVFIHKPEDYIVYAIISFVASSGADIINILYRRKFCKTKFTFYIDWKKHFSPIMVMFSMILAQTIYCNSDMTMLGVIKGDYEVGLYSTAVKIYNLVNQVVASVAFVVMPQLSASFAKDDFKHVNELLSYALNFIIILGIPCLVGLNVICTPIIGTLGGEEYLGATTSLHILSVALLCSFIGGWIGNMMLLPSGREKVCLRSCVISALLNVVLNFFLIPIWGLNGAAFTTFLAELAGLLVCKAYIDKRIKINNLWSMVRGPLAGGVFIALVGLVVSHLLTSYVLTTFVTIVISLAGYILILIAFKDQFFMSYMKSLLSKLK